MRHLGERDAVQRAEDDRLIFIQLLFTMQDFSMPQSLEGAQQSVTPTGPSRAPMTSAMVIFSGVRVSVEAAADAAVGLQEAVAGEKLEDLADGGEGQLALVRQVARAPHRVLGVAGEEGEQHDPVVGQPRHPDHSTSP